MRKGYVLSLIAIGALIVFSVLILMDDLNNKSFNDNLNPQPAEKVEKKEPTRKPPTDETKKNADSNITNITIHNKQNNDEIANYTYEIKMTDVSGAILTIKNNEREYLVFDATGTAKFNLLSNESITFVDVPANSTYTITQDAKDGYKTYVAGNETKTITGTAAGLNEINFNNNVAKTEQQTKPAPAPEKQPEAKDPFEENKVKNPTTSDKGIIALIICLVALFTLVLLKGMKLDRYEEL
jgi:hypothetical protein